MSLNKLLQNGDPDGTLTQELHIKYEKKLKAQIRKDLKSKPALKGRVSTSDIYQSVMLRLKKAKDYVEVKSTTAVLISKAKKRIRHHNSAALTAKRSPKREDRSDEAREGLTAKASTPLESLIRSEREELALRLFHELLPDDRDILTLRDVEGLTFPAIGTRLKITDEAARKRYKMAMHRFTLKLQASQLYDG
jgi:RNA polymerase sigma factor (sigma-70 family)